MSEPVCMRPSSLPAVISRTLLAVLVALFALAQGARTDEARFAAERREMIETIRAYARFETALLGAGGISDKILDVMERTERHLFIPERHRDGAYADRPVPIGKGQTISQPFIVALMTHLAAVEDNDTVLEIGTGSGYQAAVLARLVETVCTIEIIPELGERAARTLKELGYGNVRVKIGDGYKGWPDCGPFDAVIVTAALDHVPPALIAQLAVGGRLVMPVGPTGRTQELTVVEKPELGKTVTRKAGAVRFVPFTRSGE